MDSVLEREKPKAPRRRPRQRVSFEAFMASKADRFAEWVNGEVIEFMPAKKQHQLLAGFLYQLLALYARLSAGGKVMTAPYAMRVLNSAREPDIMYVRAEGETQMGESYLLGPADLVVEIVCDDSVRRDRDEKYHEYAAAGVREYWVIDPRGGRRRADFFRLVAEGRYELFATEDDTRVESSVLPGFWLNPAWLWEAEARDPLLTLMEIRGLSAEAAAQVRDLLLGGPGE